MAYTVSNYVNVTGQNLYGDLSVEDALTIQSKMLPVAKKHLTFARFAQKDTKGQNQGNVIRHRRYKKFPLSDQPLGEGVTPDFDVLESEVISHTVRQYGRYVPVTDLMEILGQDPYISIITERQAQQAAETMDLLAYKHFRAPANVIYTNGASRAAVNTKLTVSGNNCPQLDSAIRFLEGNDAVKMTEMLAATPDIATTPIRAGFIAICHPILRQDLEAIPDFVPVEKYSDSGAAMEMELGSYKGVRFIGTTQATAFENSSGNTSTGAGNTGGTNVVENGTYADVYPIVIFAKDSVGTATIGGMDSIIPKVVRPTPSGTDPLGQRGTVGYTFMFGSVILNEDWMVSIETAVSALTAPTAATSYYASNS
jgi:N4-gp56 family major capsid protein